MQDGKAAQAEADGAGDGRGLRADARDRHLAALLVVLGADREQAHAEGEEGGHEAGGEQRGARDDEEGVPVDHAFCLAFRALSVALRPRTARPAWSISIALPAPT